MSFTLYLWIQITLTITLVCLLIYQHRLYSKQKKLVKDYLDKSEERQKHNIEKTEHPPYKPSEDLLKWKEERRQFNRQWDKAFPPKIWPW